MTIAQINAITAAYVAAAKAAGKFTPSANNIAGLIDKIGKMVTVDNKFIDKLGIFDGDKLPLGKTVEEWYQDLDNVFDKDTNPDNAADNALRPYAPTYRPCSYSYTLGEKIIPTSIKYNEYERACLDAGDYSALTGMITKRLYDTYAQFKFGAKKQMIGNAIKFANLMKTSATAITQFGETAAPVQYHASSESTARTGTVVAGNRYFIGSNMASATKVAIAIKGRDSASKTWAEDVAAGVLVELNLIEKIDKPVDTTTGEAWIQKVKECVEDASFAHEGDSFNGNTVGACEDGLVLVVKKGVKPVLDVQVLAGAMNPEDLALPVQITVVDDFGDDNTGCFAVLCDARGLRLHNSYEAVREQPNGYSDHVSFFLHSENTAFISKNCFFKAFVA